METIVIIGGGASGITAAITAKNDNNNVIVFERNNKILKKLLMTGNGKCNYFNDNQDLSNYYSQNKEVLKEIICDNNIKLVKEYFARLGIVSKIKNGLYYPFSNQASSVALEMYLEAIRVGVVIKYDSLVNNVEYSNNKFNVYYNDDVILCDKLVLASGSFAYPKTGSDGMGYSFLKKFGHSIVDVVPALVPLISDFKYCKDWVGIRTDAILSLYEDDNFIKSEAGELQLTDYGISGICTFNLSHIVSRGLHNKRREKISINFLPFVDDIRSYISQFSNRNNYKNVGDLLKGILNNKLVDIILKVSNIDSNISYNDLDLDKKTILCNNLVDFKINIIDTKSFDASQVCNGGVKLDEINPNTFESLKVKGLYIIGELLDINGVCGGYNLTNAWISGLLAGKDIGE